MLKAAMLSATAGAAEHLPMPPRRIAFTTAGGSSWAMLPEQSNRGFSDARWSDVRLPHDWAIAGPSTPRSIPTRRLPISAGLVSKDLHAAPGDGKRYTTIEFDGAMSNAHVWLNGRSWWKAVRYIGFAFDLTPQLRTDGRPNVLAVRLAPEPNASRWYPAPGIYRNVWPRHDRARAVARWART